MRELALRCRLIIETGKIRIAGGGPHGGDLYVLLKQQPDPHFTVHGDDTESVVEIAPWEAALGTTVSVPTLGGDVELRVPADSDAGRKLRLRGRGLPGKPVAGDQIVELEIRAPKAETEAQRELYRKMASAFSP